MDAQKRADMLNEAKKSVLRADNAAVDALHKQGKLSARERMNILFDENTFSETAAFVKSTPMTFENPKGGELEGIITGYGSINGRLVFAYSFDMTRNIGSFGKAAAKKIVNLLENARKNGAPVVAVFDSAGARLSEGVEVLSAYGDVLNKTASLKGAVPIVSVICGNTSGLTASIAAMGDITVMEKKNGSYSFAPASVLNADAKTKNAGSVECASANGLISFICEGEQAVFAAVRDVLEYLPSNRLDNNIYLEIADDANRLTPELEGAANAAQYDAKAVAAILADGGKTLEVYAGVGKNVFTAFGSVGSIPCGIVSVGGRLCETCMNKASEFISLCDAYSIPVLTLVNSEGMSDECEAKGGKVAKAASDLALTYACTTSAKVTLIVGSAIGAAFTVLGSKAVGADVAYALPGSVISVMEAERAVQFMWGDKLAASKNLEKRSELSEAWENVCASPISAANSGDIDDVIDYAMARRKVASSLEMLSMKKDFDGVL